MTVRRIGQLQKTGLPWLWAFPGVEGFSERLSSPVSGSVFSDRSCHVLRADLRRPIKIRMTTAPIELRTNQVGAER